MATILAIGIATIDIINHVSQFPAEDDEVRAVSQQISRGGNATNTLTVLSQLGHHCHWSGVLIDEPDSLVVRQDLERYKIDYSSCLRLNTGKMPTSYITLNEANASRTIVHHRDCPELPFAHFKHLDITAFDWVHFEGRNIEELEKMLHWLRQHHPAIPCSLEVEKPRQGIEALFHLVDVLMFSRPYAKAKGYEQAIDLLQAQTAPGLMSCTWGEQGAWLRSGDELSHSPAFVPEKVVDTLGAGDTFNAGLISALVEGESPKQALYSACQLAGQKCGQWGFENLSSEP
jgi:ketohexokinase